jgi:hypothetical protein
MDCVASIPERVSARLWRSKQLTPLSADVFVSIPGKDLASDLEGLHTHQRIMTFQVSTYLTG